MQGAPRGAGVPLADRVVEVIADLGSAAVPRYRYGSGCIVLGATVLTAAHVIAGAVSVEVRDTRKRAWPASADEKFVADHNGGAPDLALLVIDAAAGYDLPPLPLAAVDRASTTGEPVIGCVAVGYPEFMERTGRRDLDTGHGRRGRTGADAVRAVRRLAVAGNLQHSPAVAAR